MYTPRSGRRLGSNGICARCGSTDAIEIRLRLNNDSEVDFHCCHRCEHRWWDAEGAVIDLDAVLELARRH